MNLLGSPLFQSLKAFHPCNVISAHVTENHRHTTSAAQRARIGFVTAGPCGLVMSIMTHALLYCANRCVLTDFDGWMQGRFAREMSQTVRPESLRGPNPLNQYMNLTATASRVQSDDAQKSTKQHLETLRSGGRLDSIGHTPDWYDPMQLPRAVAYTHAVTVTDCLLIVRLVFGVWYLVFVGRSGIPIRVRSRFWARSDRTAWESAHQ